MDRLGTVVAEWLLPSIRLIASKLERLYLPGRMRFDLWMTGLHGLVLNWDGVEQGNAESRMLGEGPARPWVQDAGELDLPTPEDEMVDLAWQWVRGLAREARIPIPEGDQNSSHVDECREEAEVG